jgi:metallophosphoesterase superfamily enzyme
VAKELDGRSGEFYEFVMPAIDIIEEGNDVLPQLISRVLLRKVFISEL